MPSPRLKRTKRRTCMFSPSLATVAFSASPTVFSVSMMYGCSSRAFSFTSLAMRPSTICARMFSGLPWRSSLPISISRSLARNSWSASSTLTYSTFGLAAICMAKLSTSSLNSGLRATKSVSQLSSRRTPMRLPAWM